MTLSFEQLMKLDLGYPGLSFGYESWTLESYLNVLEEQIAHAQAQYRLRAERDLGKRHARLDEAEYSTNLLQIDEASNYQIPRFFRFGALVSIWGLFESFVGDFAAYVGNREKFGLRLRDIRANNFRQQAEKYFEGALRFQLPWSPQERERLGHLQELRNAVAHRNGRLADLPHDKDKEIRALVAKIDGVEIQDSTILISSDYISESADLVFALVERLNQQLLDRYAGPSAP
jgi:hypothetical protein